MSNEKQKNTGRLPGFYIALCCCVLVIGVAGYFADTNQKKAENEEVFSSEIVADTSQSTPIPFSEEEILSVTDITPVEEVTETPVPTPTATAQPEYTVDNPDVMEASVIAEAYEDYFGFPCIGKVIAPYSPILSYNDALDDYRAHNGIDISADEGCSVCAAADGTVENIFANALGEGISVIHQNGYITKYMCLGSVEAWKIGDEVKAGDVLGTVGKSKGENVKEPHLHFEMYKNGEAVNPEELLQ